MNAAEQTVIEQTVIDKIVRLSAIDGPDNLDMNADLSRDLGLSSMKKVMLITSLCQSLEVNVANIDENLLEIMTTPQSIIDQMSLQTQTKVA